MNEEKKVFPRGLQIITILAIFLFVVISFIEMSDRIMLLMIITLFILNLIHMRELKHKELSGEKNG